MKHVDEFIDHGPEELAYARWVLNHFRLPAVNRMSFDKFMKEHKLFCTCDGRRWRCTGASRLGDVFLARNFDWEIGYDRRVDIDECTEWSDAP